MAKDEIKKYPDTMFIVWKEEANSDDGGYYVAYEDVDDAAEIGETIIVASYGFKSLGSVTATVKIDKTA